MSSSNILTLQIWKRPRILFFFFNNSILDQGQLAAIALLKMHFFSFSFKGRETYEEKSLICRFVPQILSTARTEAWIQNSVQISIWEAGIQVLDLLSAVSKSVHEQKSANRPRASTQTQILWFEEADFSSGILAAVPNACPR